MQSNFAKDGKGSLHHEPTFQNQMSCSMSETSSGTALSMFLHCKIKHFDFPTPTLQRMERVHCFMSQCFRTN
jgi:hypothetical protein